MTQIACLRKTRSEGFVDATGEITGTAYAW
jgi:hypothetical protein